MRWKTSQCLVAVLWMLVLSTHFDMDLLISNRLISRRQSEIEKEWKVFYFDFSSQQFGLSAPCYYFHVYCEPVECDLEVWFWRKIGAELRKKMDEVCQKSEVVKFWNPSCHAAAFAQLCFLAVSAQFFAVSVALWPTGLLTNARFLLTFFFNE